MLTRKSIRSLSKDGKYTVYINIDTWYDEASNVLRLKHYIKSPLEKNLINERINQYLKDRMKSFGD